MSRLPFIRLVRGCLLILIVLVVCGCKSTPGDGQKTARKGPREVKATVESQEARPTVRPVEAVTGRVIAVRPELRFVIIDFPTRKMPKLEQQLSVYRLDQKVAEIRISGPYLGTTVAADVTAGEALEGDLVRER